MKKLIKLTAIAAALGLALALTGCSNPASDSSASNETTPAPVPAPAATPEAAPAPAPLPEELTTPLTLEAIAEGNISIRNPWSTLKYKINDGDLQSLTANPLHTNIRTVIQTYAPIHVNAGDKVSFFANGSENSITDDKYQKISCTSDCYIYGNIMSLVDSTNYATKTTIEQNGAFANLFSGNTHILNHNEKPLSLPATTLKETCYCNLFYGCEKLTKTPELPATNLEIACYFGMFRGCKNLTTTTPLNATILKDRCYACMFTNCEKLTSTPTLPATTLAANCYSNMFDGCTALTTVSTLPATTLASQCYSFMFENCTNLVTAPELPAATLVNMCYFYMFNGCTKLTYVKCLATDISAEDCTEGWLNGVNASGTFVKANDVNYSTGANGIPAGWTEQTLVPEYSITLTGGTAKNASGAVITKAMAGTVVTLVSNTAPTGKAFSNWQSSSEGVSFTNNKASTTTFTMPSNDVSVTANFFSLNYRITIPNLTGGTVTAKNSSGNTIYAAAYGDTVTLAIAAGDHYEYSADSISVTGVTNFGGSGLTRTFTMPAQDVTVSATFTKINYSITTSGIANGTVTAKNSSGQAITSATYGQTVTLEIAAAKYYDYTADSISVTGVTNLGGSGLTRSFNMPAQNVTVSATFFTGPTVAATEAKGLGDIVLDDGRVVRYADRDKMTASQKSAAVAIIFDGANKKGVGVKITSEDEKKKWCSEGAGLYNTNEYTQSKDDGALNKSNAHPHMVVWSAGAYPAFWFAETANRKGIYNDDNWYLPAENELKTLFTIKEIVNNSFAALGITTEIVDDYWYWSSTTTFSGNSANFVNPKDGSGGGFSRTYELRACSVRVFN